jgi:hypothetical protein
VAAARLVKRFPALLDALASGELHLTGLLMLAPHLTERNLVEVLARAKHRTKRELAKLVRLLDPLPAVPARIEPLGPAPARLALPEPTWQEFIGATCPIRELTPGDRRREWVESANDSGASSPEQGPTPAERCSRTITVGTGAGESAREGKSAGDCENDSAPDDPEEPATVTAPERAEPTTRAAAGHRGAMLERPERYKVQFTATEEYVRLVEEAKALLSHAAPNVSLAELQLRAMRALVAELNKKKYATLDSSPARAGQTETLMRCGRLVREHAAKARTRSSKLPTARTVSTKVPSSGTRADACATSPPPSAAPSSSATAIGVVMLTRTARVAARPIVSSFTI